jgi:hypothetical protein
LIANSKQIAICRLSISAHTNGGNGARILFPFLDNERQKSRDFINKVSSERVAGETNEHCQTVNGSRGISRSYNYLGKAAKLVSVDAAASVTVRAQF